MEEKKQYSEIFIKLVRYCKYQERCKAEIESKLNKLGVDEKMKLAIVSELSERNYFSNKRFSSEYTIGKFRNNNWGKIKIRYNLNYKFVEKNFIEEALKEIPEDEYRSTFKKIANKVWNSKSKLDLISRKKSFIKTLESRGWEFDLIYNFLLKNKENKI
tara:strand:+ start:287 stop:763 length:477 start_codon:yes stop_codon:yes gene_type:complete